MRANFRKHGGFTLIEVFVTMGMAAFALVGFLTLWVGVAKQQTISFTERSVDSYGNFLMYRLVQDLKNAFRYTLSQRQNFSQIEMDIVDFTRLSPDTIKVKWTYYSNGDAQRTQVLGNSTTSSRMLGERGDFGRVLWLENEGSLRLTEFKLAPAGRITGSEQTLGLLDSTALRVTLSIEYKRYRPNLTSLEGPNGTVPNEYVREFTWRTFIYLKNNTLYNESLLPTFGYSG